MLTDPTVRELLEPFGLDLTSHQVGQLLTYLELLMRWNEKVNLTAIRGEEECVTRHFGESLYLARWLNLEGQMVDIGSGAGFPGLALKISFPGLGVTLLEPNARKRAFLKEAARACRMRSVEVRAERLEEFVRADRGQMFDAATARAVGQLDRLVPLATRCLKLGGRLCLWTTKGPSAGLRQLCASIDWGPPILVPLGREREIWVGTRGEDPPTAQRMWAPT